MIGFVGVFDAERLLGSHSNHDVSIISFNLFDGKLIYFALR